MNITLGEVVVWLLVGTLAGSLTGFLVKRKNGGVGRLTNLGIGLVGALIGGVIFNVFNIDLGLCQIAITFEDLLDFCQKGSELGMIFFQKAIIVKAIKIPAITICFYRRRCQQHAEHEKNQYPSYVPVAVCD